MTTFIPYNPYQGKHAPAFRYGTLLPPASSTVTLRRLPNLPAFPYVQRNRPSIGGDAIESDGRAPDAANSEHQKSPIQGGRVSPGNPVCARGAVPKRSDVKRSTQSPTRADFQHDGDNSDSEDNDLPPLGIILAKARRPAISSSNASQPSAIREELVKVGSCKEGHGALRILLGDSKDQPIQLSDSEMCDGADGSDDEEPTALTTSHNDGRTTEAALAANSPGPASSPSLLDMQDSYPTRGWRGIDLATDDHRSSSDQSRHDGNINAASTYNGKLELRAMRQGFDLDPPSPHNKAGEEDSDQDGISQHAPSSAGIIYDVFAEYEKRFGTGGKKRCPLKPAKTPSPWANSTRHDSLDERSGESVSDEDANGDVDNDLIGSPTEVASDELYADYAVDARTNDDDGIEPARKIQGRRKSAAGIFGSGGLSQDPTTAYDMPSRKLNSTPSSPLSTIFAPSASHAHKNMPKETRKRSCPPISLPAPERPRRTRKETRKAREAREEKEAKAAFASLHPRKRRRAADAYPVEDVEDVYIAEDGSLQCMVRWKSSLVAMDNLVGEELYRRCELPFKEKYGSRD